MLDERMPCELLEMDTLLILWFHQKKIGTVGDGFRPRRLEQSSGTQIRRHSCLRAPTRAQEPSSETSAFAALDLLRGTVSQRSSTVLLTLIYLNTDSKPNFSDGRPCKWRYTNPLLLVLLSIWKTTL